MQAAYPLQKPRVEKFKDSNLAAKLPEKVESVLALIARGEKLTTNDIFDLTDEEKQKIEAVLTAGYLTLAGNDRDQFIDNTDDILSNSSRNEIWERNHWAILNIISWQTMSQGRVPTIKEIAEESQLSRVTVVKHLKEYYQSDTYKEKEHAFRFLREKLLTKVYDYAYYGNMRAAKIFMDATADTEGSGRVQNQQNNFIQINGTTITREQLSQLPIEKQRQVKEIIELVQQ